MDTSGYNQTNNINERSSLLFIERSLREKSFSTTRSTEAISWRRHIFLILTEPDTSVCSAIFFFVLMLAIVLSNVIMIIQTMDIFQHIPTDCISCGGNISYMFEDDVFIEEQPPGVSCVCPPSPVGWTVHALNWLIDFLTVEWFLRVLTYTPDEPSSELLGRLGQWFQFLTDYTTMIDALSIFPYYFERLPNGFVGLRIFRILRIFQLVRLGQYNQAFTSLTNVMSRSTQYLKLLVIVLAFGAAFFGSMVYWMEKGTWKYFEEKEEYLFVRIGLDGQEEPTPFISIPAAFWWFLVTATTVGYGDMYPTSTGGRYVAVLSMMMGVLVIAFPVSVFSELWAEELSGANGFKQVRGSLSTSDNDDLRDNNVAVHNERKKALEAYEINPDEDGIVLSRDELREVCDCLEVIREREQRIRNLLRETSKY